jgi:methylated-DNA-[protein]-cysteine S-methyltransferase
LSRTRQPHGPLFFDVVDVDLAAPGRHHRRYPITVVVDATGRLHQVRLRARSAAACRNARHARPAARQVAEYLQGRRRAFDLPVALPATATPFARRVLRAVAQIPYGATRTYGEIATRAGHPGAARAVGQIMARNPLPLVIPCHRVVAAGGRLGGFGGGLPLKRTLLALEQAGVARSRSDGIRP